jgi:hypothetical protein
VGTELVRQTPVRPNAGRPWWGLVALLEVIPTSSRDDLAPVSLVRAQSKGSGALGCSQVGVMPSLLPMVRATGRHQNISARLPSMGSGLGLEAHDVRARRGLTGHSELPGPGKHMEGLRRRWSSINLLDTPQN